MYSSREGSCLDVGTAGLVIHGCCLFSAVGLGFSASVRRHLRGEACWGEVLLARYSVKTDMRVCFVVR